MTAAETAIAQARTLQGDCADTGLAAVAIGGDDAAVFLQGQLTIDVASLEADRHRLAAWCNAKGRIWALLRVFRRAEKDFLVLLPAAQRDAFVRRLRMFVLRAAVTIEVDDLSIVGHCAAVEGAAAPGSVTHLGANGRLLVLSETHGLALGAPVTQPPLDAETWRWRCMVGGEPQLPPAEQEQHIPQSLNLVEYGAVDFNKGCYPGQEIVARVHYRGRAPQTLATLYWTDSPPTIDGHELCRATYAGISVCQVVVKRPADA